MPSHDSRTSMGERGLIEAENTCRRTQRSGEWRLDSTIVYVSQRSNINKRRGTRPQQLDLNLRMESNACLRGELIER